MLKRISRREKNIYNAFAPVKKIFTSEKIAKMSISKIEHLRIFFAED